MSIVRVRGGRFGDYAVVLDRAGIADGEQLGVPTFWPAEIRELQRVKIIAPDRVDLAVQAKLIFGPGTRIVEGI